MKKERVLIVGAGLGGISAAAYLRAEGYEVEIFEKNDKIGGKLNILERDGFKFDLGPSIFTMPHIFNELFEKANRDMDDYFTLKEVYPHWRNFFEDGKTIDLIPFSKKSKFRVTNVDDKDKRQLEEFLTYSKRLYDITEAGYFSKGLDTVMENMREYGVLSLVKDLNATSSMDSQVRKYIDNPYLVDIMNFFIKYVGSSPYNAPALLNLLPYIQYEFGLWYVEGGMYNLALGFKKLLDELGVVVNLNSEVRTLVKEKGRVTGLITTDGREVKGDIIVSNMEVIPAYEKLLGENDKFLGKLEKFEPSCSGLVIHIAVKEKYTQLAHHNFFYSKDTKDHFSSVFDRLELPKDPTLYVVAPTRTDPTQAPEGMDNIKILPHIPYITDAIQKGDYEQLKQSVYLKLERMGLTDLRKNIIFEEVLNPFDIRDMYYSNKGSIYGVVSDKTKNLALKAPKKSTEYKNLFFVGGSVNPGGGMPMVTLSGINAAKEIIDEYK